MKPIYVGQRVRHRADPKLVGKVCRYPNIAVQWDDPEYAKRYGFWVCFPHVSELEFLGD